MKDVVLPSWARFAEHQEDGQVPRILVDADAMYEAWLALLSSKPVDRKQFPGREFEVRNAAAPSGNRKVSTGPMTEDEQTCDAAAPTQYWLECAYQCMKMDLQVAMGGFGFEIRIRDSERKYAHANWPAGRGIVAATYGFEAKAHYKRIRGFLP